MCEIMYVFLQSLAKVKQLLSMLICRLCNHLKYNHNTQVSKVVEVAYVSKTANYFCLTVAKLCTKKDNPKKIIRNGSTLT